MVLETLENVKAKLRDLSLSSDDSQEKGPIWRPREPQSFEVGVTSGLPSRDLNTVVEQAVAAIGTGVRYMRLDVESYQHLTPKDEDELKHLADSQDMKWGIHADLQLDLSLSKKDHWNYVEEAIEGYNEMAGDLDALYVNIHSSVRPSPAIRGGIIQRSYEKHVGPDGRDLEEILDESEEAQRWYIREQTRGIDKEKVIRYFISDLELRRKSDEERRERLEELEEKSLEELREMYREDIREDTIDQFDGRVSDWTTYMIVAWWMYEKNDPLWRKFCGRKDPEEMLDGDDEDQIDLYDAVAGAYLRGHFENNMDDMEEKDVLWIIENPDSRDDRYAGQKMFKLMHPANILKVVKEIGSPHVRMCIDWEHMATQGYDPWEEAEEFPRDIGEYVVNFDVGSHPNIGHQHNPVERGDKNLYELLWQVRKRGMDEGYILYEWGGGRDPQVRWQQSVPALKSMAKMLEARVPPDELPPEFFGLGPEEIELEKRVMERNKFAAIEGTLEFPELTHGWLGERAKRERKLEEWVREEYR